MSDPPGAPSVLGIEAVEWLAPGGENLIVRVTGRWRRRRPAGSGQPTLVVEAAGRRARFSALPEPPSLTGAGPGTWRITFAVPAALAPDLDGRSWLQFGAVVVPLPTAVEPLGAGHGEREMDRPDPDPPALETGNPGLSPPGSELQSGEGQRLGRAEAADDALIVALRQELEVRAGADWALHARLIEAESRLAARGLIERRTGSILVELRRELDGLRAALESERAARAAAERRAAELWREANALRGRFHGASEAIAGLRGALEALRVSTLELELPAGGEPGSITDRLADAEPEPEPEPAGTEGVEPQRFNDAQVRLRRAISPHETDGGPGAYGTPRMTTRPWLTPIFRRLARTNALMREWIKRAQSD